MVAAAGQPALPHDVPEPVRAEFVAFLAAVGDPGRLADQTFGRFDRVIGPHGTAASILKLVLRCLDEGRPGSFIRLGDGEGALLGFGSAEFPALSAFAAKSVSIRQFGARSVVEEHGLRLRADLLSAVAGATVVGLPNRQRLVAQPDLVGTRPGLRGAYSLLAVHRTIEQHHAELALGESIAANAEWSRALLPHLLEVLRGRAVGLVSCRSELVDALVDSAGARSVTFHEVPAEARRRPGAQQSSGHVPQRYGELLGELDDAVAGQLYLVGAGPPGKVYCDAIRQAGGIAVDVGSSLDVLAGVRSRRNITPAVLEKWALVDRPASGGRGAVVADDASGRSPQQPGG